MHQSQSFKRKIMGAVIQFLTKHQEAILHILFIIIDNAMVCRMIVEIHNPLCELFLMKELNFKRGIADIMEYNQ